LAEQDRTSRHARRQTAAFLELLHEGLGQPPLHPAVRKVVVGVVQLLGDDNLGRRWAAREAIADLIEAYGGRRP
jgi:hypothetical protein